MRTFIRELSSESSATKNNRENHTCAARIGFSRIDLHRIRLVILNSKFQAIPDGCEGDHEKEADCDECNDNCHSDTKSDTEMDCSNNRDQGNRKHAVGRLRTSDPFASYTLTELKHMSVMHAATLARFAKIRMARPKLAAGFSGLPLYISTIELLVVTSSNIQTLRAPAFDNLVIISNSV